MDFSKQGRSERAIEIFTILDREYPDARPHLQYRSAFELLVATILAAQCTDEMVNKVTPELFRRYPDPAGLAAADQTTLEGMIKSTGFYRNKTKNLLNMARALQDRFDGRLPETVEGLVRLPGVGRKTANVVLNMAFAQPTMAVDTHIFRIGNRTKIAPGRDVVEVEKGLVLRIPERFMMHAHHWLILHGRYVCKARKPECERCLINDLCPKYGL